VPFENTETELKWFLKKYYGSFYSYYKHIPIYRRGVIMANEQTQTFLRETGKKEWHNFVTQPERNTLRAVAIMLEGRRVGGCFYEILDRNVKTIYVAQFFICTDFQRMQIGSRFLLYELRRLHPDCQVVFYLTRKTNQRSIDMARRIQAENQRVDHYHSTGVYDMEELRERYHCFVLENYQNLPR